MLLFTLNHLTNRILNKQLGFQNCTLIYFQYIFLHSFLIGCSLLNLYLFLFTISYVYTYIMCFDQVNPPLSPLSTPTKSLLSRFLFCFQVFEIHFCDPVHLIAVIFMSVGGAYQLAWEQCTYDYTTEDQDPLASPSQAKSLVAYSSKLLSCYYSQKDKQMVLIMTSQCWCLYHFEVWKHCFFTFSIFKYFVGSIWWCLNACSSHLSYTACEGQSIEVTVFLFQLVLFSFTGCSQDSFLHHSFLFEKKKDYF